MAKSLGVFRIIVAAILFNGIYVAHSLVYHNHAMQLKTILSFFKYIAFIALVLDLSYFLLGGMLRRVKKGVVVGYLYCFCFTFSLLTSALFWLLYAFNRSIVKAHPDFRYATMSFHHSTHTLGTVGLLVDGLFCKPVRISFERFRLFGSVLLAIYNLSLEYYIESKGISPYPGLTELTKGQRCLLYGFVWLLFTLSYYTCRQYVRFLGRKEPDHNLAAGDGYAKSSDVSDRKKAH